MFIHNEQLQEFYFEFKVRSGKQKVLFEIELRVYKHLDYLIVSCSLVLISVHWKNPSLSVGFLISLS